MRFSVVVISYNARAVLHECLQRLTTYYPGAELLVVDTGSSDGSKAMVRSEFPQVSLIAVANRGYAYAVNRGLEHTRGAYTAVMNSDIYLEPGDLEALQQALDADPTAALAGPVLVTPSGRPQSFGLFYAPNYWKLHKPRPVGWLSGALLLVRRAALERLGGMDERFFFYNEDLEWGLRARKLGLKNLLVPRRVLHLGGASTPSDPRFIAEGYRGGLILSAEYYPWLHSLHRKAVWLEAQLRLRFDKNPVRRKGYRLLAAWLARENVNESLFF